MLAYEAEEKEYDTPKQPGRRWVSPALAGKVEKEDATGCLGAPAQAEEEAECPDSPEEEEEAEASSSEGR